MLFAEYARAVCRNTIVARYGQLRQMVMVVDRHYRTGRGFHFGLSSFPARLAAGRRLVVGYRIYRCPLPYVKVSENGRPPECFKDGRVRVRVTFDRRYSTDLQAITRGHGYWTRDDKYLGNR